MNSKRYEDYHVLDEETEKLDSKQDNEQTNKLFKSLEIEFQDNKQQDHTLEIIDVEVIEENKGTKTVTNNISGITVYQSVLTEEDEEEIEGDTENIAKKYINEETIEDTVDNKKINQETSKQFIKNEMRDTSFSSYIEADKKRERSFLVKWSVRLAKFILFMMLLPIIGIVGAGILSIVGGVLLGIIACIGGGIFILGTTCFIATQVNTTIIALGISLGITAIAFGGIILILSMMFIKKMNQVMGEHKKLKRSKEVR